MGDRTYASIKISKYDYHRHKKELDKIAKGQYLDVDLQEDTVEFIDDQANYGELPILNDFLLENCIEYNKRWEAGGDYEAGEEFARNVQGEYKIHDISDTGVKVLQVHLDIMEIIEGTGGDIEKVKEYVEKHLNLLQPFEITPLHKPNSINFITRE